MIKRKTAKKTDANKPAIRKMSIKQRIGDNPNFADYYRRANITLYKFPRKFTREDLNHAISLGKEVGTSIEWHYGRDNKKNWYMTGISGTIDRQTTTQMIEKLNRTVSSLKAEYKKNPKNSRAKKTKLYILYDLRFN